MPPPLAPGRIIYFSNSGRVGGGSAQPLPASAGSSGAQRRAGSRSTWTVGRSHPWLGALRAGGSDAGGVAQVAARRGEAAAQRYQAGTGCRADSAACPGAGRLDLGLRSPVGTSAWASPPGPVAPCFALTLSLLVFWDFSSVLSLFLNLCMCLVSLCPSCCLLPDAFSISAFLSGLFSLFLSFSLSLQFHRD